MRNKLNEIEENLDSILVQAVEIGRDKLIEVIKSRVKKGRDQDNTSFSPYSYGHKRRRDKAGLQTQVKDLHYSDTMFDNFVEVDRSVSSIRAEIKVSFRGQANRREDQRAATNRQVAQWLTEQEGKPIVGVSRQEIAIISDAMRRGITDEIGKIEIT